MSTVVCLLLCVQLAGNIYIYIYLNLTKYFDLNSNDCHENNLIFNLTEEFDLKS